MVVNVKNLIQTKMLTANEARQLTTKAMDEIAKQNLDYAFKKIKETAESGNDTIYVYCSHNLLINQTLKELGYKCEWIDEDFKYKISW